MNLFDEAMQELYTLRDLFRWGVSRFQQANLYYGHGTDNAWDEAVHLVLHGLHLPPDINPLTIDARVTQSEKRHVLELLWRRITERIPAAYLTHQAWFANLSFYVDSRVLIPRSPMAELIEQHFNPWIEEHQVNAILDLCTGSGCIAIACAHAFPNVAIDAIDISTDALAVATINVEKYHLETQVNLLQSDLFEQLNSHQKYDIIISNPPYVDAQDMSDLPKEYLHEPALALTAGEDGLLFIKRILKQASQHLTPHGILIVEVGNSEEALIAAYPNLPFYWLEFTRGGQGVFLLTAEQLVEFSSDL